jgi:hypothetical protein
MIFSSPTSRNTDHRLGSVRTLLLLVLSCHAATALASEDLIEQWYMQPRLQLGGDSSSLQNINHQTISIGRALNQRIDLEINLLSDKPDFRQDNQGILIEGRYNLKPRGNFAPYIAGGISSVRNYNNLNTSYQDPITNLGLGFEHTLKGNGAKIQADIRYFLDDKQTDNLSNETVNDWTLSFGLSIPLTADIFK